MLISYTPDRKPVPVPDAIPDEHAVFTEPLAAACGIPRTRFESPNLITLGYWRR